MAGEHSIKEMQELLAALEFLGVKGKQIAKDGLGVDDVPKFIELLVGIPILKAGYEGLGGIPQEAKDVDPEEAVKIVMQLYKMSDAIRLA